MPPDTTKTATASQNQLVPVRERHDGWTPQKQRAFLEMLAETGSVTAAAQSVGMSPSSAYRLRARDDARAFCAAWNAALERAMQRLFPAALDRALNGTLRQRFYHGELIGEERIYSDRLILWLLEKGRFMLAGGELREQIARNWENSLDALEAGDIDPPPLMTREPLAAWASGGRWLTNCPAPAGFRGYEEGNPGSSTYARELTWEEHEALMQRRAISEGSDEARRRRFFGLPPEPRRGRKRMGATP